MASLARKLAVAVAVASSFALALTSSPGAVADSAAGVVEPHRSAGACTAPTGVTCEYDVPYGDGPYQTLDLYTPTGVSGEASILLIHGGGWTGGTARDLYAVAVYLAQNGFAVFSINYTLSTEGHGTWPQPFEDVEASAGWVEAHASDYDADGSRLAAVGDSAGAHLAALLNTAGPEDGYRLLTSVSWSGPMDLALTYRDGDGYVQWAIQQLLGCVPGDCGGTDVAASPDSHVTSDDGSVLFFNARRELVPIRQARAMKQVLKSTDVPHRLVVLKHTHLHASQYLCEDVTLLGHTSTVIDATVRWLGKYLNGAPLTPTGTVCH
jgi:acetyl esterase/lipase